MTSSLDNLAANEPLLSRILATALAGGGDYADIFVESSSFLGLVREDGSMDEVERSLDLGAGLRVINGERTGFAYCETLSEEALLRAARTASAIASGAAGSAPGGFESVQISSRLYPRQLPAEDAELSAKTCLLADLEAAALAADDSARKIRCSYKEGRSDILIAGSDGLIARDSRPHLMMSINLVLERKGKRESGGANRAARSGLEIFADGCTERLAQEAVRRAALKFDAIEIAAGPMPVVLAPGDSGVLLHEAVGHGLEADFNRKGTSRFSGQIGSRVASPLCNIIDDPTLAGDLGALNVDDEGLAARRSVLIEDGVLRGYMHDRLSASLMNMPASGNGRRQSYRHRPLPRMTCTYMMAAESHPEEIIASVDRGFYARGFGGGQVDIARGDFVFSVTEGYLIEDGKVGPPVRGATLIGNGPEAMGKVSMVGNDLQLSQSLWTCGKRGHRVHVGVGMPHVKISEMNVGGSESA